MTLHPQLLATTERIRARSLASRTALLHEALIAEKPDALFHRPILHVQTNADDEAAEANERLRKLP